jgi:hypothetical protein
MSLTTKPPGGEAPARPDPAPAGGPRAPGARASGADPGTALRLLVEEIVTAARGSLEALPRLVPTATSDPRETATALLQWLSAAIANGAPPAGLAEAIERGYARVLENLAELPAGSQESAERVNLARDLILAGLGAGAGTGAAGDARARALDAPALRILVEELKSAVIEELGPVDPPPRPTPGEDPGNVAAALVRWLRAAASAANVPLARLQGRVEGALETTRATLDSLGLPAAAHAELERASEVLLGALGRGARPAPEDPVPTYRPDLPVPAGMRAARPRVPVVPARSRTLPGAVEAEDGADDGEAPATGGNDAPDLKGPMELIRRYFEDFHSPVPGACAEHFVYPACSWQAGRWAGHADERTLAAALEKLRAGLRARGMAGGRILMLRVEPLGTTLALVHARMTREDAAGRVLDEFEVAYSTVRTAAGWRIAVVMRP